MDNDNMMKNQLFIGLDVGTDSVGYAVTDGNYNLLKKGGEPMWGSHVFEAGKTKEERRAFRTARRRLDRRQQRITLLQEIFAKEIAKVDEKFFSRLKESGLRREDTSTGSVYTVFEDEHYTDQNYYEQFPTIHHLIHELENSKERHDIRLVYLACAWFMAHRGHFLSEVDKYHIEDVLDFDTVYDQFVEFYRETYADEPWNCDNKDAFKSVLRQKISVSRKEYAFYELLNGGKKIKDDKKENGATVNRAALIKLLSGGTLKTNKIFLEVAPDEAESVSLGMEEEAFSTLAINLGDDGELLLNLRKLYDWSLLEEIMANEKTLSAAKVKVYGQHKKDLIQLKKLIRKYLPKKYDEIFRDENQKDNYVSYIGQGAKGKCKKEDFCDYLKKILNGFKGDIEEADREVFDDALNRVESYSFLPKQVEGDNRVIPYQLYWNELNQILENAESYLPFLSERDSDGISNSEKILMIFEFRIPYYVGPLNTFGVNSWMQRKPNATGKIYPWNFKKIVDEDASEAAFIRRMTNHCTYLPGEEVLPKNSLLYTKFTVLNEINNISVNGQPIPVEVKQIIYQNFKKTKKVSRKKIEEILKANNCLQTGDLVSGIDTKINSSLSSYHAFKRLIEGGVLSYENVEKIIEHLAYTEDKARIGTWLENKYSMLSKEDQRYIRNLKLKDFGRFSKKFLSELQGINKETGEITTIIDALWNTNDNLMQLLSDRYTFAEEIEEYQKELYGGTETSIEQLLDDLYISNSVKRPIYRTLAIMKDIRKATKKEPTRIFIEMARGGGEKNKRTKSRRDQILEYYAGIKEDTRQLSKQLEGRTDNELQSEVLFLYFMQLGKCMYSGENIDIDLLKTDKYNVDHIYPQCKTKDDSLTNKVLVLSTYNGKKGDNYPIPQEWRTRMTPFWTMLRNRNLISEEKLHRLTRNTRFSEEELVGFLNRQLVETRQSTKALATVLQKIYPDAKIVYSKAGLVSEFRKEYKLVKSRNVNDLHHGKDAYLNIVCGNVYYCRFTKQMECHRFKTSEAYSIKTKVLFSHPVYDGKNMVWNGSEDIARVVKNVSKNNLHYTRFAFERHGGLFDQMPLKKGSGAVPRKNDLPIENYGGYNKSTASFFLLVKYREKKKTDIMIMPVDLYCADRIMKSEEAAKEYAEKNISNILNKSIEVLSFPLGLRKIKVNSVFELDGYRVAITGKSVTRLLLTSMKSLHLGEKEQYVKKLENFVDKRTNGKISQIDEKYDQITKEKNCALYDCLIDKTNLKNFSNLQIYNAVREMMTDGKEKFNELSLEDQSEMLLIIVSAFKTGRAGTCDFSKIGGSKNALLLRMSMNLSNWAKNYRNVTLIDQSPSGIYEAKSCNLMELL